MPAGYQEQPFIALEEKAAGVREQSPLFKGKDARRGYLGWIRSLVCQSFEAPWADGSPSILVQFAPAGPAASIMAPPAISIQCLIARPLRATDFSHVVGLSCILCILQRSF